MDLSYIKNYQAENQRKIAQCNHDDIGFDEPHERYPEYDMLYCKKCGVRFIDLSVKNDKWWNELSDDVYSAILTLKYIGNKADIPTDQLSELGKLAEEVKYVLTVGRSMYKQMLTESMQQQKQTFDHVSMTQDQMQCQFPPKVQMGFK